MPITKQQLAQRITSALNAQSNDSNIDPEQARVAIGNEIAQAIDDYVIGRTTIVTGNSSDGATVTGSGIIQ